MDPFNTLSSSQQDLASDPSLFEANTTHEKSQIAPQTQVSMIQSIADIFELEETVEDADQVMDYDDEDEEEIIVDLEDQNRRTEKLKGVLPLINQLWWADSELIDLAVEKLADGSRDPKWRIPLGDSGILNFFLDIIKSNTLRHNTGIHTLRLIGNSSADTDENRERVVSSNGLSAIIFQLKDSSLLPFTIPVLYNICIDYEPAQQQASQLLLTKEITELISSTRFDESRAFLGYALKILDLMAAKATDVGLAPENTPVVLLRIAAVTDKKHSVTDQDDFVALVNTAAAYLKHERFQKALISLGAVDTILAILVDSYTRFDSHPSLAGEPDENDAKALVELRSNLNQVLSDISALPDFKEAYPVISPLTSFLRRWLLSPQLQLQVCACIMLGNLARSDEACKEFVQTCQVHKPLIAVLKDATDSQLLHAALGFLKNLALPLSNKEALGECGLFDVLPRLWALDTLQQIQLSSISLARQLTIGTWENVRKMFARLSKDEGSPANARTYMSILIALFDRTDVEPIKMEISRLITSICRVFNTYTGRTPEEMKRIRIKFFTMHPDVGRPLSFMVSQNKWPVVRSEGWFVFALLARYPEGARCISDVLQDVRIFEPLVEILTGKKLRDYKMPDSLPSSTSTTTTPSEPTSSVSPPDSAVSPTAAVISSLTAEEVKPHAQAAEMARLDRENALVLVSELLKNGAEGMAVMRRTMFEDLLRGGANLMISYREATNMLSESTSGDRVRMGLGVQDVSVQAYGELGS